MQPQYVAFQLEGKTFVARQLYVVIRRRNVSCDDVLPGGGLQLGPEVACGLLTLLSCGWVT